MARIKHAHRTTEQKLADAEARANALRKQARADDRDRKILVGAMLLGRAEKSAWARDQLLRDLDIWLTRPRDRRKFLGHGLGPIRGLYGATLQSVQRDAGWSFGRVLPRMTAIQRDRYGNYI